MTELLDSTVKKKTVHDGFSNIQDRIRHLFIDGLIVLIASALIRTIVDYGKFFDSQQAADAVAWTSLILTYLIYYISLEFFFGFTIGKLLNKTRVISVEEEEKPSIVQIMIRTVSRLIPIGFVTIITPYKAALNDILSKTRTVRIKKKNIVHVNEI